MEPTVRESLRAEIDDHVTTETRAEVIVAGQKI
jgi:hypothetical protein